PIFVGNAGTAMRFLAGWLCFVPGRFLLQGEQRMHQRPIGDLVEVLMSIGAEVEYVEAAGYPPLRIRGKKMRGGFDVAIAADILGAFGARVERRGNVVRVRAARLQRDHYRVEGDYSSASYWFAAAAATGGTIRVRGLANPSAQGDAVFLDILARMGCRID